MKWFPAAHWWGTFYYPGLRPNNKKMKNTIFFLRFLAMIPFQLFSQNDHVLHKIEAQPNQIMTYEGDLSEGALMPDLSWAWNSSVACFPATQKQKFTGNHVLYTLDLPKYSEMEVTVIPNDPEANFSVYAYEIGLNTNRLVPNLSGCIRCEVAHKWDRPYRNKTQDHTRIVSNLVAINRSYQVIIGVVGAEGLMEGGYSLKIDIKSR